LVPVKVVPFTVTADPPVFVSVTVCGALLCFTTLAPKFRLAGTSFTEPVATVIVALSDFVLSEAEVAVSVTVGLAGSAEGEV